MSDIDDQKLSALVRDWIVAIGEDPARLSDTPARVAEAWEQFTSGYRQRPEDVLSDGVFENDGRGTVIVKDIDFYSMCEHHLVPFFGKCHIAYVPDGRILGLSKLARLVEVFARRLQVQERLTSEIAGAIDAAAAPRGVAVLMEARHLCMLMRGVQRPNAVVTTTTMLGSFETDAALRNDFLSQLR